MASRAALHVTFDPEDALVSVRAAEAHDCALVGFDYRVRAQLASRGAHQKAPPIASLCVVHPHLALSSNTYSAACCRHIVPRSSKK
jgi:hypothetical protein